MSSASSLPISQAAPLPRYSVLFSEPDECLPEPLPTLEAIEDAPVITEWYRSRRVAFVGNSYAVKYGDEVEPLEAENMRFVRQNTNVRVPRVYAVYQSSPKQGEQITYIVMDRIPGRSLDKMWDGLDTAQKMGITQQLKVLFATIRNLPDSGFFGSIDQTKLRHFLFLIDQYLPSIHGPVDAKGPAYYSEENRKLRFLRMKRPVPSIEGPFDTEEALINGLLERFLAQDPERRRYTTEHYRRVLFKVLECSSRPIFTHCDLQLKNIMLQPDGRIVIIDWERSGWYPVYWEYAISICADRCWEDDWHSHINLFLDEYPNQYIWLSRLRVDRY